jgi:trigger factor
MNKKKILGITLIVTLTLILAVGCSNNGAEDETPTGNNGGVDFSYSDNLDENGFWQGITALEYVTLPEYTGIEIPAEVHNVSDAVIDEQLYNITHEYSEDLEVYDRAIVDGDTVNIDYVGTIDGEPFEGGNTQGMGADVTIGVTQYIDDFLEQLIGREPGESFDIEVTFPDDYHQTELAGKDAVFSTTVNYIAEHSHPELTDEFVASNLQEVYGVSTVEELMDFIRENVQITTVEVYLQNYLIENSEVTDVPQMMIDYQTNAMLAYYQDYADQYQVELVDFLEMFMQIGSVDELIESTANENRENAKFHLIVQALAEEASLSVDEDDISEYFLFNMGIADYSGHVDFFGLPYIKLSVMHQAVMDHIMEHAELQ